MTAEGSWLAFARAERCITLEELQRRLESEPSLAFRCEDQDRLVVSVHERQAGAVADIVVQRRSGPAASARAVGIAERNTTGDAGSGEPDLEMLLSADVCYEIRYGLNDVYAVYNALWYVAGELLDACEAVLIDEANDRCL